MSGFSHLALQQAIYTVLSGDATLTATAQLYDRPPEGTAYPYITVGEAVVSDHSNIQALITAQAALIHVWSREGGRKQAATLMERIYVLLNRAPLTVAGQTLVSIEFNSSSLMLEDDGWTYQGIMRFDALLQAN